VFKRSVFKRSESRKSDLRSSNARSESHVTFIDLTVLFEKLKIEHVGKPAIPGDVDWWRDLIALFEGILKALGVKNYKIVYYQENPQFEPDIDELKELLERYPECDKEYGIDFECLSKKTGKKYVVAFFDLGTFAVAEILE